MTADWISWSVLGIVSTMLLAAFYRLSDRIAQIENTALSLVNELHARVNSVKDDYVRRDDLAAHLGRIEMSVRDLRADLQEQHRDTLSRLNAALATITHPAAPPHIPPL